MDTDVDRTAAAPASCQKLSVVRLAEAPAAVRSKHEVIPGGYRTIQQTDTTVRHGTDSLRFRRDLFMAYRGPLRGRSSVTESGGRP
jgi:hypothetical protein